MEGGGFDFFQAASNKHVVDTLHGYGATSIGFSCDASILILRTGSQSSSDFVESGLIISNINSIHIMVNGNIEVSIIRPVGHLKLLGLPNMIHITSIEGDGPDLIIDIPEQRAPQLRHIIHLEEQRGVLDVESFILSKHSQLPPTVRKKLGMHVKDRVSRSSNWKTDHKLTHERKRTELELLRSRSRSRDRKPENKSDNFAETEEAFRGKREDEAQNRLAALQEEIETKRNQSEIERAVKAAALKEEKEREAEVAKLQKDESDQQQLKVLLDKRIAESEELESQRKHREEEDKKAHLEREVCSSLLETRTVRFTRTTTHQK